MSGNAPEDAAQPPAGAGRDRPPRAGRRATAADKLARRMVALPAGRYELILTISDDGLRDWSIRWFGKVEHV